MLKIGEKITVNRNYVLSEEYEDYYSKHMPKGYLKKMLKVENREITFILTGWNDYLRKDEPIYMVRGCSDILIFDSEVLKEKQLELF